MPGLGHGRGVRRPQRFYNPRLANFGNVDSAATFDQAAATWAATATETFSATGAWTQATATWAAAANEAFAASGSFTQAAAAWAASAVETFASTATWNQASASWAAIDDEGYTFSASFAQGGGSGSTLFLLLFGGEAATVTNTWDAVVTVGGAVPPAVTGMGGRFGPQHVRRNAPVAVLAETFTLDAAFAQAPASWAADMDTDDDDLFFLLFDEPSLIGAR